MRPLLALLCLSLCGCAASFGDFYSALGMTRPLAAYSGKTEIFGTYDPNGDIQMMRSRGYELIGVSEFQSAKVFRSVLESQLRSVATNVGADVVLWRQRAGETTYAKMPILIADPIESHLIVTSSSANANVQVGGVSGYGSSTGLSTTLVQSAPTYHTETVDIAQQHMAQLALFFRKAK